MVFHPAVIALYVASMLICFMILYAARYGVQILSKWDIHSGSELQLILERKTYLISTLLTYAFAFQIISFFLYIFTADRLHPLFVGAMCAAGTLKVNGYGYPALIAKIAVFLLAGLWLILNYADNRGYDYPLIKKKYFFLLAITPLVLLEAFFQIHYFLSLKPDIITSCCGTLFSAGEQGLTSGIASLPPTPMKFVFYLSMSLTLAVGLYFYRRGQGGYWLAALSAVTFPVSLAAVISFISLYFYELPTHHCPFCLLQPEYGYIGYVLYAALFTGAICGMGTGMLMPFREIKSLARVIPSLQKKLAFLCLVFLVLFTFMVTYRMVFSNFILEG